MCALIKIKFQSNGQSMTHCQTFAAALTLIFFALSATITANTGTCVRCHSTVADALPAHHDFQDAPCTPCHAGNPKAELEADAHHSLIARPGELVNSRRSCGGCHAAQVDWVMQSPMALATQMVQTTRAVMGEEATGDVRNLGQGPTDNLLRKLCVSCHLGQPQSGHEGDPIHARGGGCLACHLQKPDKSTHGQLDALVGDRHCFGCHSRSGRISLNYAGLGEIEPGQRAFEGTAVFRLGDGRHVEQLHNDVHHRAGMGCTDCHTGPGIMGAFAQDSSGSSIDISCEDCHRNSGPRTTLETPTPRGGSPSIPFETTPGQGFLTTARGTPLWHVEVADSGTPRLYRKQDGQGLEIPQLSDEHANLTRDHQKLTCDACHAAWAPQCFGCHMDFDPEIPQWDHLERAETPGSWQETRWDLRNQSAPIGHRPDGRIGLFVPGMIFTLDRPDQPGTTFIRRFAPLHPHTTGPSRSCHDCHRDPRGLGLGEGRLEYNGDRLSFTPAYPLLEDGLPADGWATLERDAVESHERHRPLPADKISELYRTPLPGDRPGTPIPPEKNPQ